MKKYLIDILVFTLLLLMFIYVILFNNHISNIVYNCFILWIKKVIPTILPTMIIVDLIINSNIPYLFYKIFHINPLYLFCIISGSPTNGYILNNKLNDITKHLAITTYSGLIFSYISLKSIFDLKTTLLLLFFNILCNLIIFLFIKPDKLKFSRCDSNILDVFINSVKKTMIILLNILGFIIIFNILPIDMVNNTLIKGLLYSLCEVTSSFNYLSYINLSYGVKVFFSIISLSTCGLCISCQLKSIISDTCLNYKKYLVYRMIHLILFLCLGFILVF